MEEFNQRSEVAQSNSMGFDGASALEIRLDTKPILRDIEFFLRGKEENFYQEETGRIVSKLVDVGTPLLNAVGVQGVLNFCRNLINSQVVQGSTDEKHYLMIVVEVRMEFARLLATNWDKWKYGKTDEESIDPRIISNGLMKMIELFLSRTIGNKERESFNQTVKMMESNRIENGGFKLFGNKKSE